MYIFAEGWDRSVLGPQTIGRIDLSNAKEYEEKRKRNLNDSYLYDSRARKSGEISVIDGLEISWGTELYFSAKYQMILQLSKNEIAFLFAKAFGNDDLDAVLQALENARSSATPS